MIPQNETEFTFENVVEVVQRPSFTHLMLIDEERVKGYTNGQDAIRQMIYKCINTEAGEHIIYPTFGVRKSDLFGKRKEYAFVVLTRRITDALLRDERILEVSDFVYLKELSKEDNLAMRFKVKSIFSEENEFIEIEEVIRFGR